MRHVRLCSKYSIQPVGVHKINSYMKETVTLDTDKLSTTTSFDISSDKIAAVI